MAKGNKNSMNGTIMNTENGIIRNTSAVVRWSWVDNREPREKPDGNNPDGIITLCFKKHIALHFPSSSCVIPLCEADHLQCHIKISNFCGHSNWLMQYTRGFTMKQMHCKQYRVTYACVSQIISRVYYSHAQNQVFNSIQSTQLPVGYITASMNKYTEQNEQTSASNLVANSKATKILLYSQTDNQS